jgi:hypothetical protein
MTGILAQTITLTSYGNEYLENGKLLDFYPKNSSFGACHSVVFKEINTKDFFFKNTEIFCAENPLEWFELLKKEGCKKLRLFYQSEKEDNHKLAGFVSGSGNVFIECVYENYSDFWNNNWNHDENLDEKPWKVFYEKVVSKQPTRNQQDNLVAIRIKLKRILEEITEFAVKETTGNWGDIFEKSKNILESDKPESESYHNDLIVRNNYELENRQLLMSADKSFVFGGMGSWNDMWFENEETEKKYNELSTELYGMIIKTIVSTINNDKREKATPNT